MITRNGSILASVWLVEIFTYFNTVHFHFSLLVNQVNKIICIWHMRIPFNESHPNVLMHRNLCVVLLLLQNKVINLTHWLLCFAGYSLLLVLGSFFCIESRQRLSRGPKGQIKVTKGKRPAQKLEYSRSDIRKYYILYLLHSDRYCESL